MGTAWQYDSAVGSAPGRRRGGVYVGTGRTHGAICKSESLAGANREAFELNLKTGELRKGGVKIRLQDQSFQILAVLLDRPGMLVTH